MKTVPPTLTVNNPWHWSPGDACVFSASADGAIGPETYIVTKVTGFELTLRPPTLLERLWFWFMRVTRRPRLYLRWRYWDWRARAERQR